MLRSVAPFLILLFVVACTQPGIRGLPTAGGNTVAKIYRIPFTGKAQVQLRMLNGVNALRSASGVGPVRLNAALNAAASTHARDMSVQNRPWHFGSDGSSPIDRVRRAGYPGTLRGEAISETFETELETLAAWMAEPGTRDIVLDPRARDMGFAFVQERSGKIWWTLIMGARNAVLGPGS